MLALWCAYALWLLGCGSRVTTAPAETLSVTMDFPNTQELYFRVQDPRDVAGGMHEYRASVIPLVRLKTGRMVVPWVQIKHTRRGFMDRPYHVLGPQSPMLPAYLIVVPDSPDIDKYVFLVQAREEDSGWRYHEVTKRELAEARKVSEIRDPRGSESIRLAQPVRVLEIADILDLQRIDDRTHGRSLWDLYEKAEDRYKREEQNWNR